MTKTKQAVDVAVDLRDEERLDMQEWFDRWADQFGARLPGLFGNRFPELWGAGREIGGVIKIEETSDAEGITIRGEIPGIDPDEDLEITVDNGRLHISAERRQRTEEKTHGGFRTEFKYGSFRRTCSLPAGAVSEDISATYDDGILEIKIPVTANVRRRRRSRSSERSRRACGFRRFRSIACRFSARVRCRATDRSWPPAQRRPGGRSPCRHRRAPSSGCPGRAAELTPQGPCRR